MISFLSPKSSLGLKMIEYLGLSYKVKMRPRSWSGFRRESGGKRAGGCEALTKPNWGTVGGDCEYLLWKFKFYVRVLFPFAMRKTLKESYKVLGLDGGAKRGIEQETCFFIFAFELKNCFMHVQCTKISSALYSVVCLCSCSINCFCPLWNNVRWLSVAKKSQLFDLFWKYWCKDIQFILLHSLLFNEASRIFMLFFFVPN